MIEIVQNGQAGKASLLFDMHRLRARVFKEKMGWDVDVDSRGLEVDDYDLPETIYLLALNKQGRVIGNWRLQPTSGPTMVFDIWPEFLSTIDVPRADDIWEASRFAVNPLETNPALAMEESKSAVAEMFCALTELCLAVGIKEVMTLYDVRIARVIRRLNCQPYKLSEKLPVDNIPTQVGLFRTDDEMLLRIREATGIKKSLIDNVQLPRSIVSTSFRSPILVHEASSDVF